MSGNTGCQCLDRRRLLQGTLALTGLPGLCCRTPEVPPASVAHEGASIIIDLQKAPELRRTGTARALVDIGRKVNIVVVHPSRQRYVALDRSCTHGGAQVTYNHRRRTVQCTSVNHAEYDLAGTLLHGRTHGNLRAYPVRLAGSRLEIVLEPEA